MPAATAVLYVNANVVTLDPERPHARGLRVQDGHVTHVFDDDGTGLSGRRTDLNGATVLPGLVDAHLHVQSLGASAWWLDLKGTTSKSEIVERIRARLRETKAGAWVRGRGWDQNDWPEAAFPTAADLDVVAPEHPVWLTRIDGHAVWVNSQAMRLAGLDRHAQAPSGGEIVRDAAGNPTGILIDNAIELVALQMPQPTAAELRADLERGLQRAAAVGLTAVHDMGTTPEELEQLRALAAADRLPIRVVVYLDGADKRLPEQLAASPRNDGLLQIVGVKLYADGALGSRGAALLAPYSDRPNSSGLLMTPPETLNARARAVHAAGYQIAIHAIGDRGNRVALKAIAQAQGSNATRRHRIEHAQVVAVEDIPRFAALGVVASMQPTHATSDMPWAPARLGSKRLDGAYAWQRMLGSSVLLAFGSDAPVEEENPWLGIYAAVTRQDLLGQPPGGWLADQRLDLDAALRAFAIAPRQALGDSAGGILRPGAVADLTVVDRDPAQVSVSDLPRVRTLRTIVAGHETYRGD